MKSRLVTFVLFIIMMPLLIMAQDSGSKKYDESFDPLKLKEPKLEFFNEESQQNLSRQINSGNRRAVPAEQEQKEQVSGYRIQLVATPNYQEVDSLYEQVKVDFEGEANAYLVYDSPNYKIRLGDFEDRVHAETLLDKVKKEGFRYAWIVRSNIRKE